MKKLFLISMLVLVGCSQPVQELHIEVEDKVVEPVEVEMKYTDVTPQQVREHIAEIDKEIALITNFDFSDIGRNAEKSRKMLALRDTPMPFGNTLFDKPYGYCGSTEIFAVQYWYSILGGDKNKTAKDDFKIYKDYKKACLEAVDAVEKGEYKDE